MINVLQIINSFDAGGAERVAMNLAVHLNPSRYRSFMCAIDGMGAYWEEIKDKDVEIVSLNKGPGFKMAISWKLAKYIKKNEIDIITTHNYSPLLYGRLACMFAKVKVFIHVDHVRDFEVAKKRSIGNDRQLTASINKVVAVSEDLKRDLMKYEKLPANRIDVIINGIDQNKYDVVIDIEEQKRKLEIGSDKMIIGTCARLSEQKGLIYLLQAVRDILKHRSDFCVLIVGDGPLRGSLESAAEEYRISEYIKFLGYRDDIPALLQLMDVYVLPSVFEGLPLSLLEAMAAKRAIIATRVGDNEKVLDDGNNGLLVPSRSALSLQENIERLLDNAQLRRKLGDEAYKDFYNNYTIETMIDKYEALYETEILKNA